MKTHYGKMIGAVLLLLVLATSVIGAADLDAFWTLDLEGNEVTQEIFSPYRLTWVNVWATFCPPCLQEMPDLAALSDEYASKGVQILGVVTDVYHSNQQVFMNNLGTANAIIEKTGADYVHLLPSQDLHELRLKYVQVVPETFFVDSTGKIVGKTYYGAKNKAAWKSVIDSTLALLD